jgi:hypothetical protein
MEVQQVEPYTAWLYVPVEDALQKISEDVVQSSRNV